MKIKKDYIGWLGVILLLAAYLGITIDLFSSKSFAYNFTNLIGGALLAWRVWQDRNYPNFVFELIFISIAIYGLVNLI